jgi:hypothetical protein
MSNPAPPAGKTGKQNVGGKANGSNLVSKIEGVLKLVAGGSVLIAAMGLPSVFCQYARFNIPTQFISYEEIIRAGVLPAILLALMAWYFYWVSKNIKKNTPKNMFNFGPSVLLLPFFIAEIFLYVVGALSLFVLYIWGLLWLIKGFFSLFIDIDVSNKILLFIAIGIVGFYILAYIITVIPKRKEKRLVDILKDAWEFNIRPGEKALASGKQAMAKLESKNQRISGWVDLMRRKGPFWDLLGPVIKQIRNLNLGYLIGIPVCYIVALYAVKGVLQTYDPEISKLVTHLSIIIVWGICWVIWILFFALVKCVDWMKKARTRRRAWFVTVTIALAIYFTAVGMYSYAIYPRIDYAFGGGKPKEVVIWFNRDEMTEDIQNALGAAVFKDDGQTVKGENLYLLYAKTEKIIIADKNVPPASGILISKDSVKAISW